MNENKSTKNESSLIGNTTMSTKTNTQFPDPLPKEVVKHVTCGGSPSVAGTADDVTNPLELLKRVPKNKAPDAKVLQTKHQYNSQTERVPQLLLGTKEHQNLLLLSLLMKKENRV